MKKLHLLSIALISTWIGGSLYADPVIKASSNRDIPDDAFSPTSSITILASSTVANGSALNLFGGMGGVEGDDALFADAQVGTTYFVNWQTSAPIALSSYRVVLTDDEPSNNRAISQVRLFSSADSSFANPTLLSSATISTPYGPAYAGSGIEVRDRFSPVTAQFFRLEFVNASVSGPRIVEVDGNVATPACIASPSGLVAWYPGDGNANDVQNGNNGALQGGVTFATGEVGQAFSFNGVDGQIVVPHNASQNTGSQITIEAWVDPSSSGHGRPIAQKRSSSNVGGYTLETTHSPFGPDNGLAWVVWIGGTPQALQTPANVLTNGQWQHVAATYDGTTMRIYVNGVQKANMAVSGAIDSVSDPLVIGQNVVNPSFAWQGLLDEIQLFNRALTGTEIRGTFNAESAGNCKIASTLGNISTRLPVQTGDNVLIAGFILTGTQPKKVIVRGIGPSLPLSGALADPTLELHDASGVLESNDNWVDSPNKQAIVDSGIPPTNNLESAIVRTLPANGAGYTAVLRGVNNGTGIGVVEAYDLDRTVDSKFANISTRGLVQTGDNVLFAGTIVVGQTSQKVLIRAIGPSLSVPGKMADPTLELHDGNGALLEANDNWVDSPNKQAIIDSTIPPSNDLESAIVRTLAPGNYTAIVRGASNTTGIAVVEVYALQ